VNQNCTEIPSHPSQTSYNQENKQQLMVERTVLVGMQISAVTMKITIPQKKKKN
jgi:ketol-acid reductoisomerase